jgi:hypothetical protein
LPFEEKEIEMKCDFGISKAFSKVRIFVRMI